MIKPNEQLRRALRGLLLPINAHSEAEAIKAAAKWLTSAGIRPEDWFPWIDRRQKEWEAGSKKAMPTDLAALIGQAIKAGFPSHGAALGNCYPEVHQELQAGRLSAAEASDVLSYAPLIATLRNEHRMSAAQIAKVIEARSPLVDLHWDVIATVLSALKLSAGRPAATKLRKLRERDREHISSWFGDASQEEGPVILDDIAVQLGFQGSMRELMSELAPPDSEFHVAYLQILHIQLTLAEFFDHPLTVAYEFSPRSTDWQVIHRDPWPSSLRAESNPILNNAKSVYELNEGWARSKKPHLRPAAFALVDLLEALDAMPDRARKELAAWIRAWILRLAEMLQPPQREEIQLTEKNAKRLLDQLGEGQTQTHGIIEQRVVDALAVRRHPPEDGWVGRGLGDSVFAPNRFRRKLGDCDFQYPSKRLAFAYEAHGGKLSTAYLESHLATLRRVIAERAADWAEDFGDPSAWVLNVVFVVHDHDFELPPDLEPKDYADVRVNLRFETFSQLIAEADPVSQWLHLLLRYAHRPLVSPNSREETYRVYRRLLGHPKS